MALTILDDSMSSDLTTHRARLMPTRAHLWEVSWLPGHRLDRNGAITAMVLADSAARVTFTRMTANGSSSRAGLTSSASAQTKPSSGSASRPPGRPPRDGPTGKPANEPALSSAIAEGTAAAPRAGLHRGRGRRPTPHRPRQGLLPAPNRAAPQHQDREVAAVPLRYKRKPLRSAAHRSRRIRKDLPPHFRANVSATIPPIEKAQENDRRQ